MLMYLGAGTEEKQEFCMLLYREESSRYDRNTRSEKKAGSLGSADES
jgi:hypothetical protein